MRNLAFIVLCLIATGCSRSSPTTAATNNSKADSEALIVFDYNGAAGYGRRIKVDGDTVSIIATSDFQGQPDKLIWNRELSAAERAFLAERIDSTPLIGLKDEYRNPNVWDGLQIYFEIRQSNGHARSISVANEFVEELAALCDLVNLLVPEEHRVDYREWKVEEDITAAEWGE
jgi:hypothetical protein